MISKIIIGFAAAEEKRAEFGAVALPLA